MRIFENDKVDVREKPLIDATVLFLSPKQWRSAILLGIIVAVITWPLYDSVSLWLGVGVFFMGVVTVHFFYASRIILPLPHIALFLVGIQYILAAWLSVKYPSENAFYNIGAGLSVYLGYATLVFIACIFGWSIGLSGIKSKVIRPPQVTRTLLRSFDAMIVLGVLSLLLDSQLEGGSLGFILVLLGNLRYLGVFGRMITKKPGWVWRFAFVFGVEVIIATDYGMFGDLIIWGLWGFALWVFLFKPSVFKLGMVFAIALVLMPAIHESKWRLREKLFGDNIVVLEANHFDKFLLWVNFLGNSITRTITGNLEDEFIGDAIARYNQGWIIHRVMLHVPEVQPYANGSTLKDAIFATIFPRFIMPNKIEAGGQLYMERYAGVKLARGTSMNLGFGGEMYANFGFVGGVIGCGLYTLVIALLLRWVMVRAFESPLWLVAVPYVGFICLKPEDGIVEVANWTFKAFIIFVGIIYFFPAIRRALFPAIRKTEDNLNDAQKNAD